MELLQVILGGEPKTIFFNFLSFGALIVVIFSFLIAAFLLMLPNKSRSTVYLGIVFLTVGLFNVGYVVAQMWYEPSAAFHRWGTVFWVLIVIVNMTQFLFHFPENRNRTVSRIFALVHYVLVAAFSGYFFVSTLNEDKVFFFTGHYWDFNAQKPSLIIALFIFASIFVFLGVGIWKAIVNKGVERWATLAIVIGFLAASVLPSLTNIFSRDGSLDRGIHQTGAVLAFVLGLFVIVIVYINSTKDSTKFMAKIVGVTLVTVLLLMQFLAIITLRSEEVAYDSIKEEQVRRITETGRLTPEVSYMAQLDVRTNELPDLKRLPAATVDFRTYRAEFRNTAVREEVARSSPEGLKAELPRIMEHGGTSFAGYRKSMEEMMETEGAAAADPKAILEKHMDKLDAANHIHYTKLNSLHSNGFRAKLEGYLTGKDKGLFLPFHEAITGVLKSSDLDGPQLKQQVLQFIAPFKKAGARLYRQATDGRTHFVAYMNYQPSTHTVVEVGYPYTTYRLFIHRTTWKLKAMLLVVLVIVLALYPLFFRGALVNPLQNLLSGVTMVNAGDLTVHVPVKVHDEIGFLATSFNSMVSSIREAREQLQDYAANLEHKVKERTAELNKTLEQVQALKVQQDGDYFLTSLLSKPLNYNANKSKLVTTEFLIQQKKKFEFRKKASELGGDICVSGTLRLGTPENFKRYIVAVNGDAMGKSMQGAGGSLVMGVVLNTIMARSAKGDRVMNQTPEQWMRDVYDELHGVFLSFNGSMVISATLALIQEETGEMYYFNAEHPFQVLFRNGRASFIEEELTLRKIGLDGEFPFAVHRFQLEPGDVVIMASDGRDDIDLTPTEAQRTINDDEYLFLQRVEESRGALEQIVVGLERLGTLTDDLSFIRIGFHEHVTAAQPARGPQATQSERVVIEIDVESEDLEEKEKLFEDLYEKGREAARTGKNDDALNFLRRAYELRRDVPALNKILAVLTFKEKDYRTAVTILSSYLRDDPAIVDFWLYLSIAHKRIGNNAEALEAANRVFELNPDRIPNLVQLADLHQKLGNQSEARRFLDLVIEKDPENEQARALMGALRS